MTYYYVACVAYYDNHHGRIFTDIVGIYTVYDVAKNRAIQEIETLKTELLSDLVNDSYNNYSDDYINDNFEFDYSIKRVYISHPLEKHY